LTLSSASGEALFALAREKEAKRTLAIHNHADKLYGEIEALSDSSATGGTFCVSTPAGSRIHFRSDTGPRSGGINATADDGRLLAIVEPPANLEDKQPRSVVIGPLVDAGLIVLSLLAIDWLRLDQRAL
jgi:hypothetical protein